MIKNFNTWLSEDWGGFLKNTKVGPIKEITDFCEKYQIKDYEIHEDDWSISVKGSVYFNGQDFEKLPLKFKNVTGDFWIDRCKSLTSLKGCPEKVGRYFDCDHCKSLTSLEGCPERVDGYFSCMGCNSLTSLEGCPEEVGKSFFYRNCEGKFTEKDIRNVCNVGKTVLN